MAVENWPLMVWKMNRIWREKKTDFHLRSDTRAIAFLKGGARISQSESPVLSIAVCNLGVVTGYWYREARRGQECGSVSVRYQMPNVVRQSCL